MIIGVTGVLVDDQEKALKFYTEMLGFLPKHDIPFGNPEGDRWLTVVSPERPDGVELSARAESQSHLHHLSAGLDGTRPSSHHLQRRRCAS